MDKLQNPTHGNSGRSSNGCWTCRVRRKKCDETQPVCVTCAALHITCHYGPERPEWMDGGPRQDEMAMQLRREVKEMGHRCREERAVRASGNGAMAVQAAAGELVLLTERLPGNLSAHIDDFIPASPDAHSNGSTVCPRASANGSHLGANGSLNGKGPCEQPTFGRSDTFLVAFYLDSILPFLFPFYHPSSLQGGKAWILEMMIRSPVVRQATLCQSSYFFSLVRGDENHSLAWESVLEQTQDAFEVLRQSLKIITDSSINEHLPGAVRILASIMQILRFEITLCSFTNCQAHLQAALTLFGQLLESIDSPAITCPGTNFDTLLDRLGPRATILSVQGLQVPSAEQAAFRFSSALLILNDIIISTVLQEPPRLLIYHPSLLGSAPGAEPRINLEAVMGCQNWVLIHIGEIAALDSWKRQCKRAGNLDVMELVRHATAIKAALEAQLAQVEADPVVIPEERGSVLDAFSSFQRGKAISEQTHFVTAVWAHAALLYLSVVVSGWQPSSVDGRYHVCRVLEILLQQISPPACLSAMAWPICVAGCFAEPEQESRFRELVHALQPPSIFGTLYEVLAIMRRAWCKRAAGDLESIDLAMFFRRHGDLVLLV